MSSINNISSYYYKKHTYNSSYYRYNRYNKNENKHNIDNIDFMLNFNNKYN